MLRQRNNSAIKEIDLCKEKNKNSKYIENRRKDRKNNDIDENNRKVLTKQGKCVTIISTKELKK